MDDTFKEVDSALVDAAETGIESTRGCLRSRPLTHEYHALTSQERKFAQRSTLDVSLDN